MEFGVAIVVVAFERRGPWARLFRSVLFIFLSLLCCLGFAGLVVAFVNHFLEVYLGFGLIKIEFASLSHGQSTEFRIDWLLRRSCKAKLRISFWFITCCRNLEFEFCAGWLLRRSCEVELRISFWFYYVLS